jgi:hypothetical protein
MVVLPVEDLPANGEQCLIRLSQPRGPPQFKSNRHWLEVHQLPPYSPELNPTERLWQHTRKNGTHNRFFAGVDALLATLTRVFGEVQSQPELIRSYLVPFC